jgi:hypothetical protein
LLPNSINVFVYPGFVFVFYGAEDEGTQDLTHAGQALHWRAAPSSPWPVLFSRLLHDLSLGSSSYPLWTASLMCESSCHAQGVQGADDRLS